MNDIRDVKPPLTMPDFFWLWIILGIAALAVCAYFFFRCRKPSAAKPAPVMCRPPWDVALERLQDLAGRRYPEQGMFKPFYSMLSDIVRHYLEDRFRIKAPEMTTEEFLSFMQTSAALKLEHKEALKDFLNGCDMVKFAKHQPSVNEAQDNFALAQKLVLETKDGI